MNVLVHIGTEKTGSTTLQEFLHLNREGLQNQDIAFLKSPGLKNHLSLALYCMDDDNIDVHIKDLGISSVEARQTWQQTFKESFYQEVQALPKTTRLVVLSSEHLHSRLRSVSEIERLSALLKPLFSDVKIAVYLRRQDQVATSLFSNIGKSGGSSEHILPQGIGAKSHFYNYQQLLEKWSSIFGKAALKPRILEADKLQNGNLLDDFSHLLTLNPDIKLSKPKNQNESLSAKAQDLLIHFNSYFPRFIDNEPNPETNSLRRNLIELLQQQLPGPPKKPTREQAESFYAIFKNSNKQLAKTWFGAEQLFSEDFSSYPSKESVEPLAPETQALLSLFANYLKIKRRSNKHGSSKEDLNKGNASKQPTPIQIQEKTPWD